MKELYYDTTYMLFEDGKNKGADKILIRSTSPLSIEQIKSFIHDQVGTPKTVVVLLENKIINKETYMTMGGDEKAPWFK